MSRSDGVRRNTQIDNAAGFDDLDAELLGAGSYVFVGAARVQPDFGWFDFRDFVQQVERQMRRQVDGNAVQVFGWHIAE